MNVWVVRAEFGKHADNFRNGGYVALDFDISEPYPIGEQREAFVEAYKKYIRIVRFHDKILDFGARSWKFRAQLTFFEN